MLLAVTGMRREARIAESSDVTTISGGGDRASLERQLEAAFAAPIQGIVSFGVAGALAPSLRPGDCVFASHVLAGEDDFVCDPRWLASAAALLPEAQIAAIAGSDIALADSIAKASLFKKTGAVAADMESHLAARAAKARNIPFLAIRTISDGAERALPPAALAALKPDGRIDMFAVGRSLLARPAQIPDLVRTARESEKAFAALLRCRDVLGRLFAFPDFG